MQKAEKNLSHIRDFIHCLIAKKLQVMVPVDEDHPRLFFWYDG